MSDDDIVISGFSARFPQADSLSEFTDKLYRGDDFVTDDYSRWTPGFLGLPHRMGTIRDLSKFDTQFFGVHPKQADVMDPQLRLLLETSYEAIIDAGYDPATLRGGKIGVFVGCSQSGTAVSPPLSAAAEDDGYVMLGGSLSMFSNRISYSLDFHGPSATVDTACSSTMTALNNAVLAIRSGQCEAAIVGGCNVILNPSTSLALHRMTMLSNDGKCKVLDADANGFVRSETVGAIFLQRGSKARRVYAKLVHIRANSDGYKTEGITHPSRKAQEELFREVYAEAYVDPHDVCYVEVHGTGTKVGDPEEVAAISSFFCQSPRERPLMIGSVKSNVGHAEGASGICSIAKVILAMETGTIAGNLHFTEPNPKISSLLNGTIEVVDHNKPFVGAFSGINSSGFGGTTVHTILQAQSGPHVKSLPRLKPELPRLVLVAGRNADTLAITLEKLVIEAPHSDCMYALLNNVGQPNAKHFPFRGFTVIPPDGAGRDAVRGTPEEAPLKRRPLWFVFTGLGCQWNGMARQMMHFDVFSRSIQRSHEVVKQFDLDLIALVTSEDLDTQSAASTFVSITALQVGLVDMLSAVGVRPDGFLGHSLGEIGCAYADGALSAEQAVLCAYWRGQCVESGNLPEGAMAVVGLTWEQAVSRCRKDVFPACHNAADFVTVSGLADPVARFAEDLKAENVFVTRVNSPKFAFHCPYIRSIAPTLREALEKVIPEPKLRSSNWISSSVPERCWEKPIAQRCSADYFVNNFLSPVFFYEALQHVPRDAILIEIAPHSLLQGILRGALSPEATCLGLMKRDSDNPTLFLRTLGQLHVLGVQLDLRSLYPPVAWPVPRGTPGIGHFVSWDHSQSWRVAGWEDFANNAKGSEEVVEVDLKVNEADAYLAERKLNGQVVFPAAAYMVLAWKSLISNCGKPFDQVPVIFEHITIHQDIVLPDSGAIRFLLHLKRESGHFQVNKGDIVAASGRIRMAEEDINLLNVEPPCTPEGAVVYQLQAEDVYKELRLRGYECNGVFRGISKADIPIGHGKLKWEDNWVTFIDAMLQFLALNNTLRSSTLPTRIEYCCVDPQVQARVIENGGHAGIDVVYERSLNTCRAGGAVIQNVTYSPTSRLSDPQELLLEEYHFVPYFDSNSDRQHRQAYVNDYAEMCSSITRRILDCCYPSGTNPFKLLPEVHDIHAKTLDRFPEYSAENHGLLRTLITVLDSVNDSPSSLGPCVQSAQSLHKKNLETDLLNTALYAEDPLRHLLDIVTENTFANKLNILELASQNDSLLMAPWVCSHLSILNSGRKMEYAVSHAYPDCLITEKLCEGIKIVSPKSVFSSEGELPEADLVVARLRTGDFSEVNSLPEKLSLYCKRNAFVLISMRTAMTPAELFLNRVSNTPFKVLASEALQTAFENNEFRLVAHKSNNLSSLLLFRKCLSPVESCKQEMVTVNSSEFEWVETLKEKSLKCERGPPARTIWLLAGNPGISGIVGLATCLSLENVGRHIRYVFDASHSGSNKVSNFSPSNPEYRDVVERDLITNVYCDGQWGSYRHIVMQSSDAPKKSTQFAYMSVDPGNLSSVQWYESTLPYKFPSAPKSPDRVLCSVYYAPLNIRDVMIATSKVQQDALPRNLATSDSVLGIEFSGRDPLGRRVMGLVASEAMATVVAADQCFLWEVPAPWSLQEASTVPFAYSTAYYALLVRGNMRTGESLLVHGGSCDVSQAAISIALSMGCTVFATVGSAEGHHFLRYRFPELDERHIVNSAMTSLESNVLLKTEGRGVDLVLYYRAKETVQATLRCLSPHGRFLDISPLEDIADDVSLGKSALLKSITFYSIPLDALFADNSAAAVKSRVAQLVRDGITTGAVRPLDTSIFGRDKAEEAFRFMASASHIGKVVLEIRQEESERKAVPASPLNVEAVARTWFYHRKSYVIIGGLGGVGLELADWMVSRGCRKLLLCSRFGLLNGYQRLCLHRWERSGAKVLVSTADASTEKGAREIIEKAMTLGPVGGVFNLAVVLSDALLENQSAGAYKAACKPKVDITQRLDELTRGLCPELDHFVVFSSVVCGRGNVGQTNYGYANSVMERICERRAAHGFPALAIQWGAIADVGIFHKTLGLDFGIHGTLPQRINSCLEVLDHLLNQNSPVVSCCVKADQSPKSRNQDTQDLVQLVAHILGMKDSSSLKPHVTLGELGLDSMIGVKVLHTIERHCGLVLSMQNIGQLNVKHLEEMSKGPTAECRRAPKMRREAPTGSSEKAE